MDDSLKKAIMIGFILGLSTGIVIGTLVGYDRGLNTCDKLIKDINEKEINTSGWVYERPDNNNLANQEPLQTHNIINNKIN